MSDDLDDESLAKAPPTTGVDGTLYALARTAMREYIPIYLELARKTHGLAVVEPIHVQMAAERLIVLAGIGSPLDPNTTSPEQTVDEWDHKTIPFDLELAITRGVYLQLRSKIAQFADELEQATHSFHDFDAAYIAQHPYLLPILQRVAGIASKAMLKRRIGSASDAGISLVAAERLASLLNQRQSGQTISRAQLLQSVEPTLEGIVRDLVGRVLLEDIVTDALDEAGILYKRESEYRQLEGVVYSFRADYVIPDELHPRAFIEVRKSSSRHASLYAKDKMFSAINWKGRNKELLAILIVDGPWTSESLRALAQVFDYVVPLHAVAEVTQTILAYLSGDTTKLKWHITFSVDAAT